MDSIARRTILASAMLAIPTQYLTLREAGKMPSILQVPVPNGGANIIWNGRQAANVNSLLFINQDLNNYVYLGNQSNITPTSPNVIPLAPNGTFSGDPSMPWYVTGGASGIQPLVMVPNGQNYFLGITQGLGNLVIPSVQSPNFVNNVSGWQISKNGNAQFNNLVIRGTFNGIDFVINSSGSFFYSGTPALGNLIVSIANNNGTDAEGNGYGAGVTNYINNSGVIYTVNIFDGEIQYYTGTPANPFVTFAGGIGINALTSLLISGGLSNLPIQLSSALQLGPVPTPAAISGNSIIYSTDPGGSPGVINSAGMSGVLPISQTDPTVTTVTAATYSALSKIWSIPDDDPNAGTKYVIKMAGVGETGTTQEVLDFRIAAFGLTWAAVGMASGQFPVSTTFNWDLEAEIVIKTTGASGEVQGAKVRVALAASGVNQEGGTGAQGTVTLVGYTGLTSGVDTTQANTMTVQCQWGSSTVGATIASGYSEFERKGP